jgi:hypothetical protein
MSEKTIIYDLYETKFYKNQYINTLKNNGYIEIIFKNNKGETQPNLIYENTETNYKTRKLSIIPTIHELPVKCDGELLIELEPITNGDQFVYIVIPLKTERTIKSTKIDKLIDQDFNDELPIDLNKLITSRKCYANKKGIVFIMDKPIQVYNDFKEFNKPKKSYFAKYNENNYYKNDITKNINNEEIEEIEETEGFVPFFSKNIENMENKQVITECTPIGAHGETIEQSTYSLPTGSMLANKLGEMNVLATASNYFAFFVIIIIVYLTAPFFYQTTVLELAKKQPQDEQASTLKGLDLVFRMIYLGFPVFLTIMGLALKQNLLSTIGFLIFLFITIGIFVIELKKSQSDIYTLGGNANTITNVGVVYTLLQTIFEKNLNGIITIWMAFIIVMLIILVVLASKKIYYPKDSKKKNYKFFGVLWGGLVTFSLPLIALYIGIFKY